MDGCPQRVPSNKLALVAEYRRRLPDGAAVWVQINQIPLGAGSLVLPSHIERWSHCAGDLSFTVSASHYALSRPCASGSLRSVMGTARRFGPALGFERLTRFYDPLICLVLQEDTVKLNLVQQVAQALATVFGIPVVAGQYSP